MRKASIDDQMLRVAVLILGTTLSPLSICSRGKEHHGGGLTPMEVMENTEGILPFYNVSLNIFGGRRQWRTNR